jgi:hypothetical protein
MVASHHLRNNHAVRSARPGLVSSMPRAARWPRMTGHGAHGRTGCCAAAATVGAIPHVANAIAAGSARVAYLGARSTDGRMHGRIAQHEVRRRLAQLGAIGHQAEVFWLDVGASHRQAMCHCCLQAYIVAFLAQIDAALHFRSERVVRHDGLHSVRPPVAGRVVFERRNGAGTVRCRTHRRNDASNHTLNAACRRRASSIGGTGSGWRQRIAGDLLCRACRRCSFWCWPNPVSDRPSYAIEQGEPSLSWIPAHGEG